MTGSTVLPFPRKDQSMLPWKMLLQHETYFPGKPSPSAKEIVKFLESRVSSTGNETVLLDALHIPAGM